MPGRSNCHRVASFVLTCISSPNVSILNYRRHRRCTRNSIRKYLAIRWQMGLYHKSTTWKLDFRKFIIEKSIIDWCIFGACMHASTHGLHSSVCSDFIFYLHTSFSIWRCCWIINSSRFTSGSDGFASIALLASRLFNRFRWRNNFFVFFYSFRANFVDLLLAIRRRHNYMRSFTYKETAKRKKKNQSGSTVASVQSCHSTEIAAK